MRMLFKLLVADILLTSLVASTPIPGGATSEVKVLVGSTLSLDFHAPIPEANIKYCFWQFRHSVEDLWDKFLGFNNLENSREELSSNGYHWEFLTPEPCVSGIKKTVVPPEGAGAYILDIQDTNDGHTEYTRQVNVVDASSLTYTVKIHRTELRANLFQPPEQIGIVKILPGDDIPVNVSLDWPGLVYINGKIRQCVKAYGSVCSISTILPSDVTEVAVRIDPQVQGAEEVLLTRSVKVHEAVLTHSGGPIVGVVFLVILLVIVIVVVVLYWWKKVKPQQDTLTKHEHTIQEQTDTIGRLETAANEVDTTTRSLIEERDKLEEEKSTLSERLTLADSVIKQKEQELESERRKNKSKLSNNTFKKSDAFMQKDHEMPIEVKGVPSAVPDVDVAKLQKRIRELEKKLEIKTFSELKMKAEKELPNIQVIIDTWQSLAREPNIVCYRQIKDLLAPIREETVALIKQLDDKLAALDMYDSRRRDMQRCQKNVSKVDSDLKDVVSDIKHIEGALDFLPDLADTVDKFLNYQSTINEVIDQQDKESFDSVVACGRLEATLTSLHDEGGKKKKAEKAARDFKIKQQRFRDIRVKQHKLNRLKEDLDSELKWWVELCRTPPVSGDGVTGSATRSPTYGYHNV